MAQQPYLDHVQIAAPPGCESQARRFYGELLGLGELEKPARLRPAGGVWFALGDAQLHIGVEERFSPARKAHPALAVDGAKLDELARRLTEAGMPVRWDDELSHVRRFFTDDPWGNRLEILASPDPPDMVPAGPRPEMLPAGRALPP